jgi:hypothetical protein
MRHGEGDGGRFFLDPLIAGETGEGTNGNAVMADGRMDDEDVMVSVPMW